MRVAILGSKEFDSLEYHLEDSFTYLGHEVFHIDIRDIYKVPYIYNYWAIRFFKNYAAKLFNKVAAEIIERKPELVVCTYRFIHPDAIRFLRKELPNARIIHVNPDQLTTLEKQEIFASPYDAYYSKDLYMVDFMKNKMNLNTFYFPEAFNQRIHKAPIIDRAELENQTNIDVLTFGTMYPYRTKMLEQLVASNINLTLFGKPDKTFGETKIDRYFNNEFITGSRKSELLYGSKIVFNNFHYAEINSVNVKFFEIFGCGGFQICDSKSVIKEYSAVDPKEFTFNTIGEAVELINYYLDKPLLRHEIAAKQMQHFKSSHTYDVRIKQLTDSF